MMVTYKQVWADDGSYRIQECLPGGRVRTVSEEQPDYLAWLAAGNEPEEVPYVPYVLPAPSLDDAKAGKKREIAAARYQAETGGLVVGGVPLATDDRSKALLMAAYVEAKENPDFEDRWKGTDGIFYPVNAAAIIAAYAGLKAHIKACFAKEAELSAAVDAAETVEEVDAVTWG